MYPLYSIHHIKAIASRPQGSERRSSLPWSMKRLRDRSTGDILVLMVAGTVCVSVMLTGATITVVEVFHPSTDTSGAVRAVSGIINTLIGLLAGFLAGRTDYTMDRKRGEEPKEPPL
jgi:hypothetical protein